MKSSWMLPIAGLDRLASVSRPVRVSSLSPSGLDPPVGMGDDD